MFICIIKQFFHYSAEIFILSYAKYLISWRLTSLLIIIKPDEVCSSRRVAVLIKTIGNLHH